MRSRQAGVIVLLMVFAGRMSAQGASDIVGERPRTAPRAVVTDGRSLRDGVRREAIRFAGAAVRAPETQNAAPPRRWAGRHPVLLGALIGLGAGLAVSASEGGSSDLSSGQVAAFFGGIGAGSGAAVGGIVGVVTR